MYKSSLWNDHRVLPVTDFGFAMWWLRMTKLSTQNEIESERNPSINFSDRHIAKPVLYEVPTYLALNFNLSNKQKNKKKKSDGK